MPALKRKVETFVTEYYCDKCKQEVMQNNGGMSEGLYAHKCYKCGHHVMLPEIYPKIEYKAIEEQMVC